MIQHLHNLFVHGLSAAIENADDVVSMQPKGNRILVEGRPSTDNWLHYAVPSPVIVDERRLRPGRVWLRYRVDGDASVNAVHVWDGDTRIAAVSGPTGSVEDGWTQVSVGFDALEVLAVYWGLGISIGLSFGAGGGRVEVATAGCDFDYANRVCSQRFPIRTDKRRTLEFPYRSNLPIDVPNGAIQRILISLHGTGGDGDLYLDNGLAAADAGGASADTLIVAPQFIYPWEYYRTSEFYRTHMGVYDFPADLLYWPGGRAYGTESEERDRDGDGVPDSGTVCSYAVLDTILERLSMPRLFPNLQRIVVAGQSNGGQFVARYAATSRFEDEVAAPRGIGVRYLAMSSGSYLYLDDERRVAGSTNAFAIPAGCPGYDAWPWGVGDLSGAPDYVRDVGAATIRRQFENRDVVYLHGALDTTPHVDDCEVELQGGNTVEKGEIYFNHLRHHYGHAVHQRHVVAGVGHTGRGLMTSADGLAALFGP